MNLRDLKREVGSLPSIKTNISSLKSHWIKPIKAKSNLDLSFINELPDSVKAELNSKLKPLLKDLKELEWNQSIHEKLAHYCRYLIELKLTTFNGNARKGKFITNHLLEDEYLNLKDTIEQVQDFGESVEIFSKAYEDLNEWLCSHLTLDEQVQFLDQKHAKEVRSLKNVVAKQKKIVKHVGNHFVSLVRESKKC